MSIDQALENFMAPISQGLASVVFYSVPVLGGAELKLILVWLVAAAVFFTIYFGFINVRFFKHAIDIVRGKYDTPKADGTINRFQALATALSGTVGLGNIGGVAIAISLGGPGAALWMAIMGLFGMSLKFMEVTCSVKYRHHPDPDHPDKISGGPMHYLKDAFSNHKLPILGNAMAYFYAAACAIGVLGAASLFQTNQVFQQLLIVTGGPESFMADKGWIFGLFMVVLVGLVIVGGIRSIAAVTSKIVPFMGVLYLVAALAVISVHYQNIPHALLEILQGAFYPEAGLGALVGTILIGVQRATFSNEAGLGTSPIAHAAAKTNKPVSQGMVAMLEPFIDTVCICTLTSLVIVISGVYEGGSGMEGVALTSRAFASVFSWFPYILFAVVFLFAYSTLIAWSYYGVKTFSFIFGSSTATDLIYKVIFCIFIVIGASANLSSVVSFTDSMIFLMALPNIIGLYFLAPEIKKDLNKYIKGLKKPKKKKA